MVHAYMLKPYFNRENLVLHAMKENGEEDQDLEYWERASTSTCNPEAVNVDALLSQIQKEEVIQVLNNQKCIFKSIRES